MDVAAEETFDACRVDLKADPARQSTFHVVLPPLPNAVGPNAVVKAFVPFMRRMRPEADARDWIACGIFDWRAIYISALGAQSEFHALDENAFDSTTGTMGDIPAGHLPQRLVRRDDDPATRPEILPECRRYGGGREPPTTLRNERPAPFRYLLLTKLEPKRRQLGRMIERVNTTGDRRLYALKNWTIIEQASKWIRVYGMQLDAAYQLWIRKTDEIRASYDQELWGKLRSAFTHLPEEERMRAERIPIENRAFPEHACRELKSLAASDGPAWRRIIDRIDMLLSDAHTEDGAATTLRSIKERRDLRLAAANQNIEHRLIEITANLDRIGRKAIGGLPYRVSRSKFYADLGCDAVETLRVGDIETWWSYKQFASRGMEPALRYIAAVGDRLGRLRERLQVIKQDILQSSIANQTKTTRDNTYKLEVIQLRLLAIGQKLDEINSWERSAAIFSAIEAASLAIVAVAGVIALLAGLV